MKVNQLRELKAALLQQVGKYSDEDDCEALNHAFTVMRLTDTGRAELYEGLVIYQAKRQQKIADYCKKINLDENGKKDPLYFRKKFILFMSEIEINGSKCFRGDPAIRKNIPEAATITMENFLGKKGVELYKLALEEEMRSESYMDAVFKASITHFEGEKWVERPVVIVAGPSGSGKSFAATAAIEKATKFLPKDDNNYSGNDVVTVDGGVAREVSQIRKLVIQVAINKGFTGIEDLHKQSAILREVKHRVREAVFQTQSLGVVIPETFSKWVSPINSIRNLMQKIDQLPKTKQIFTRIEGQEPSSFQHVVNFMGSKRAWKTGNFVKKTLNLNQKKVAESKAYDASGFKYGDTGSRSAEAWFKKNSKVNLSMIISNDLCIMKEDFSNSNRWKPAKQGEQGAIIISKRIYDQWHKLQQTKEPDLSESEREQKKLSLIEYNRTIKLPPTIRTSAEIDVAIAVEQIRKRIVKNEEILFKQEKINNKKIEKLQRQNENLLSILYIVGKMDPSNKKDVQLVMFLVKNKTLSSIKYMPGLDRTTQKALTNLVIALNRCISQLQIVENNTPEKIKSKLGFFDKKKNTALPVENSFMLNLTR